MKSTGISIVAFILSVAALAISLGLAQDTSVPTQTRWEYKSLTITEVTGVQSALDLFEEFPEADKNIKAAAPADRAAPPQSGNANGFSDLEQMNLQFQSRVYKRIVEGLNRTGEEGWELVDNVDGMFLFKRPRK